LWRLTFIATIALYIIYPERLFALEDTGQIIVTTDAPKRFHFRNDAPARTSGCRNSKKTQM